MPNLQRLHMCSITLISLRFCPLKNSTDMSETKQFKQNKRPKRILINNDFININICDAP